MRATDGDRSVEVLRADLLVQDVDAIVNAANEQLEHGGGIAAAIARAAGPELLRESAEHERVPTGTTAITTAGDLPQRAVLHAVGPIWRGGRNGEPELLRGAHHTAIRLADRHGFESIALPAISCGVFGYPVALAAEVAVPATLEGVAAARSVKLARFCLWHDDHLEAFRAALRAHVPEGWRIVED
jgi:O-acetyl-ADP-ribose deacetylase (regulator of RNase III)